jgi:hypothetical protein
MARANLKKSKELVTNTIAASKYIPSRDEFELEFSGSSEPEL